MTNSEIIKDYEKKMKELMEENFKLYVENTKLKSQSGRKRNTNVEEKKETKPNNTKKTTSKKTNNSEKSLNETKKNTTTKTKKTTKSSTKTTNKKPTKNEKKELSKFQQERENKKNIVLEEMLKKTPVVEIAKKVGQSEPTVRNYIRELRLENKLAR